MADFEDSLRCGEVRNKLRIQVIRFSTNLMNYFVAYRFSKMYPIITQLWVLKSDETLPRFFMTFIVSRSYKFVVLAWHFYKINAILLTKE